MDLIYTNAARVDQGVLTAYSFDMAFGSSENDNDFEMTLGQREPALDFGAVVYFDGTEYGGIVDGKETSTDGETITYTGRTWHGIIDSKIIQPDPGTDYLVVSGDANEVLAYMIDRLGLGDLFVADSSLSGISVSSYKFKRYCSGYDGIMDMLASVGAKLLMIWENRTVRLSAAPVVDYTDAPVDGDVATLTVKQYRQKVNHLICLGRGELAERAVIHLYVDAQGNIGDVQAYFGLDEVADVYDYSNAESDDDLHNSGVKHLKELRDNDKAEIAIDEERRLSYDIGDIVGATDIDSGVSVSAAVTRKIVKINNGAISVEYKTGS